MEGEKKRRKPRAASFFFFFFFFFSLFFSPFLSRLAQVGLRDVRTALTAKRWFLTCHFFPFFSSFLSFPSSSIRLPREEKDKEAFLRPFFSPFLLLPIPLSPLSSPFQAEIKGRGRRDAPLVSFSSSFFPSPPPPPSSFFCFTGFFSVCEKIVNELT